MIQKKQFHALSRLWVKASLSEGTEIALSLDQTHYLCHVLRLKAGDGVRLFDGETGEWLARITEVGKKSALVRIEDRLRPQAPPAPSRHVIFSPIRKERMDFLIEKAVELGVTDFHPVIMDRSMVRDINPERLHRQIQEAAEQSERLDLPVLHALRPLTQAVTAFPEGVDLYGCIERVDAPFIGAMSFSSGPCGFVIGPEGGFTESEREFLLARQELHPVSLGPNILRAETAVLFALSVAMRV